MEHLHPPASESSAAAGDAHDSDSGSKKRLLDAAEAIFAERGFEGASMRAITRAAGMSVSAANYHFGTKEALLAATLRRHLEAVNQRRFQRLAALEAAAAPGVPDAEAVLSAFLRPAFEEPGEQAGFRTVAVRLYSDPPERVAWLKAELFAEVRARFAGAMRRALPRADETRLALAFEFCIGVMLHVIAGHHIPGVSAASPDRATLADAVVRYASGGFVALLGEPTEPSGVPLDEADPSSGDK